MAEERSKAAPAASSASLATFLRGLFADPRRTGAISPSSAHLARAIAAQIDPVPGAPVVELGPGTGVITDALVARGIAPEQLVLVEFNPEFCSLLTRRYPEAHIVEGDAAGALADLARQHLVAPPAAVVSGLPLLNFPLARRAELIRAGLALGGPDMPFVQFSYGLGPPVAAEPGAFHVRKAVRIWRNLPPATVWIYNRADS